MRTITAIILAIILLAASIGTGSVFAQGEGDDGYPVVTEPTPDPTTPPADPPDPTPAPPRPTPEPPAPTPNPTKPKPRPVVTDAPLLATQEPDEPSPVCEGLRSQPVFAQIAERYHVAYDEVMVYFCEYGLDVGEIVLLLNTMTQSESEVSLKEILAMRLEDGLGWEEIWQALGINDPGEGGNETTDQPEALIRNKNRDKFNHQASNSTD